jgi:hypothetical protein
MGFDWISASTDDNIDDSIMDRINLNLTTLFQVDLDIGTPDWTWDAEEGNEPLEDHMDEVKAAVDYADNRNFCRTHYNGHLNVDNSTYNNNKDNAEDSSVYSGHFTTKQDTHYTSRQDTHYTSRLHIHNGSHDANYHGSRRTSVQSGQRSNNCPANHWQVQTTQETYNFDGAQVTKKFSVKGNYYSAIKNGWMTFHGDGNRDQATYCPTNFGSHHNPRTSDTKGWTPGDTGFKSTYG